MDSLSDKLKSESWVKEVVADSLSSGILINVFNTESVPVAERMSEKRE